MHQEHISVDCGGRILFPEIAPNFINAAHEVKARNKLKQLHRIWHCANEKFQRVRWWYAVFYYDVELFVVRDQDNGLAHGKENIADEQDPPNDRLLSEVAFGERQSFNDPRNLVRYSVVLLRDKVMGYAERHILDWHGDSEHPTKRKLVFVYLNELVAGVDDK